MTTELCLDWHTHNVTCTGALPKPSRIPRPTSPASRPLPPSGYAAEIITSAPLMPTTHSSDSPVTSPRMPSPSCAPVNPWWTELPSSGTSKVAHADSHRDGDKHDETKNELQGSPDWDAAQLSPPRFPDRVGTQDLRPRIVHQRALVKKRAKGTLTSSVRVVSHSRTLPAGREEGERGKPGVMREAKGRKRMKEGGRRETDWRKGSRIKELRIRYTYIYIYIYVRMHSSFLCKYPYLS